MEPFMYVHNWGEGPTVAGGTKDFLPTQFSVCFTDGSEGDDFSRCCLYDALKVECSLSTGCLRLYPAETSTFILTVKTKTWWLVLSVIGRIFLLLINSHKTTAKVSILK